MISKAVEVIFRVRARGSQGVKGASRGSHWAIGLV